MFYTWVILQKYVEIYSKTQIPSPVLTFSDLSEATVHLFDKCIYSYSKITFLKSNSSANPICFESHSLFAGGGRI